MPGARLGIPQREVRLLDGRIDQRVPSGAYRGNALPDHVAVAPHVPERHVPGELVVEGEDPGRLLVTQHVHRRLCCRLGQLHGCARHAPGAIEHDDERDFRFVAALEGHRCQPLQRRMAIALLPEDGLAAGNEQTPAPRFHPLAQRGHRRIRERRPPHIAEHDDIPGVEISGGGRDARRGAHGDIETSGRERARQVLGACRRTFDVEDRRLRLDPDIPREAVVGRERVARHRERPLDDVGPGQVQGGVHGNGRHPLYQRDLAAAERGAAGLQGQDGRAGPMRADPELRGECGSGGDPVGQGNGVDPGIRDDPPCKRLH